MRAKIAFLVLACAAVCLVPVTAAAKHSNKKKAATKYYLALGDSLAQGAQPNSAGTTVAGNQGYADQLLAALKKQKKNKSLKLAKLGCLGESTTTMMNGGICKYATGNQLAQAVKFLKKHKGKVTLVTIDIGANDIDKCVSSTGSIDFTCVASGQMSIHNNVPKIAATLRKAAGANLKIVGMTYYDPFLAEYLAGPSGQAAAAASVSLARQVNDDLTASYKAQSIKVADVATAFDTYTPFSTTTTYNGQTIPLAVARICQWTWMCAPSPQGPNIHANTAGYQEIETVFKGQL